MEDISEILRIAQDDNSISGAWDLELWLLLFSFGSTLENSFAAHIEIFHDHLCGLAIRTDSEGDAASADSVFAFCLVREHVAIIVFHRESLVLRPFDDRQSVTFFDDSDVPKEIVRVPANVGAIFQRGRRTSPAVWNNRSPAPCLLPPGRNRAA